MGCKREEVYWWGVDWGVYGDEHFGVHRVGILGCVWVCILGYIGWVHWGEHITVSTSG